MPGILDNLRQMMLEGTQPEGVVRPPLQINPAPGLQGQEMGGGILGRAVGSSEPPLWGAIRQAYRALGGGGDSVRLNNLRAALPNVSREDMDSALLGMRKSGAAVLQNLDNPPDIASVGNAALKSGAMTYHTLWLDPTRAP